MIKNNLPEVISVFPLSNFILFPQTSVPLNIFEPRYIKMVKDSMNSNKLIGMIQPKISRKLDKNIPDLHSVGCLGKIVSFQETSNGRFLIELKGLIRFQIIEEILNKKQYRECRVNYNKFYMDLTKSNESLKFSDLELIFQNLKNLFEKKGYVMNWKGLKNQSLDETINALAMASPFSLEEKQILLESENLNSRKSKITEILNTYSYDNFNNTTIQ